MLEKRLRRELEKAQLSEDVLPQSKAQWQAFISALNQTYQHEAAIDQTEDEVCADVINESRMKSRFMENMSYEIRTLIHGVLGSLEILKNNPKLDITENKFVDAALMSGENLLDIANNILDYSKINAGELELEESNFSVRDLLADINKNISAMAAEKMLTLEVLVPDNLPEAVKGDPAKVRQIIKNLANNAIKFTHQGKITSQLQVVKQNEQETILRFEITDTGIGLSESRLKKLSNAFSQHDGLTTRQFESMGLGLTICKKLVDLMGGRINLESIEGKGTHFWVDIPFKSVDINDLEEVSNGSVFSDLKVLIIEKQGATHSVFDHYFSKWGVAYEFVDNCGDAIDALHQARNQLRGFDVVMIDYYMPGMECFELSALLNTQQDFQRISKVTLSSYNLAEQEREIANIELCLTKPIRETLLKDTLMECLKIKNNSGSDDETDVTTDITIDEEQLDILLAEDNPVNALLATTMMEQIGLSVKHVKNGQQAVDELKNNRYKLVLMDMIMPVMDGYEATRHIRQWEQDAKLDAVPIIALTANALAGDKQKCLSAGMNDYLPKPIKQKALQQVISKWAEKEVIS